MTEPLDPTWGPLVIGLGSPDRGDDGIGPAVAEHVERLGLPGVRVAVHEDPTALIHLWAEAERVIIVDAVVSGAEPGSVTVKEVGTRDEALPSSTWAETGRGGTHAFGLATAVELARAIGRLPRRVTLVGIEGASFDYGAGLTPMVEAAIPEAVVAIRGILDGALKGSVS